MIDTEYLYSKDNKSPLNRGLLSVYTGEQSTTKCATIKCKTL